MKKKTREENLKLYEEDLKLIDDVINTADFESYEVGEKIMLTDKIFFFKLNYEPKNEPSYKLENHKKMIDIHYAYQGTEGIIVCDITKLKLVEEYNEEKDVEWYQVLEDEEIQTHIISPGEKLILFPGEAHEPELREGSKSNTKIVFKIQY